MRSPRSLSIAFAVGVALALTGCGSIGNHNNGTDATANNNGAYLKLGDLTYQLQVSRSLNPFGVEDHQYLTGLPAGTTRPTSDQFWYGVFLWAQNKSDSTRTTTGSFDIRDTQGNVYYPVTLDTTVNQYAWTPQSLQHEQTEPGPDTTASHGPTGGGLVLFKLPASVYANRPLTLEMYAPGTSQKSTISLDL